MISETQAQTFLAASNLAYQSAGPSPGSGYQFLLAFPDAGTGCLAHGNLDAGHGAGLGAHLTLRRCVGPGRVQRGGQRAHADSGRSRR